MRSIVSYISHLATMSPWSMSCLIVVAMLEIIYVNNNKGNRFEMGKTWVNL